LGLLLAGFSDAIADQEQKECGSQQYAARFDAVKPVIDPFQLENASVHLGTLLRGHGRQNDPVGYGVESEKSEKDSGAPEHNQDFDQARHDSFSAAALPARGIHRLPNSAVYCFQ
jgi:hypothetical protein